MSTGDCILTLFIPMRSLQISGGAKLTPENRLNKVCVCVCLTLLIGWRGLFLKMLLKLMFII